MIPITDHVFYPLDKNFKYKFSRQSHYTSLDLVNELSELSRNYSLSSTISGNRMMWKDEKDTIHLIFHFNIKGYDINKILAAYKDAK